MKWITFRLSKKITRMEDIISPGGIEAIANFIAISKKDPKAELECKLLSNSIQIKNEADRLTRAIEEITSGNPVDEHRFSISFQDQTRVNVLTPQLVHKLCLTNSFREIPLTVERKQKYYEGASGKNDTLHYNEISSNFTLRSESPIRKDWDGSPNDVTGYIRIIHRRSYTTKDKLFRIDFSMVKFRKNNSNKTIREVLKQPHIYELEIEFIDKKSKLDNKRIVTEFLNVIRHLLEAYYESPFLLKLSDIQRYKQEFKLSGNTGYDLVTLLRKHLNPEKPHNISKDYTVTNKADGERSYLYVARDRKLLKISSKNKVTWTGFTAINDDHVGDCIDGEYIPEKLLFCIFDVYRFRNRDTRNLPLLKTDDDISLSSRLGCAALFVEDLKKDFVVKPSASQFRIETKLFLAGDGVVMENAIKTILQTEFEYEIDGLIFTPRDSPVAPQAEKRGRTWTSVYKWKPASQNSIDFLVRLSSEDMIDPLTKNSVKKGNLFVSRNANDMIVDPRGTMTGEYVPPELPADLKQLAEINTRIPSFFQPDVPRDPEAYKIMIPVNDRNTPVDVKGIKVEDNTIVECAFDTSTRRWIVLRTRYDKTYEYRVENMPQYGNDFKVANDIWTSMHVPIEESMLTSFVTTPLDVAFEDDMYYRDDLKRNSRTFTDVYTLHNIIKNDIYKANVIKDDTVLELACGRGGDMMKLKALQPSKVVGMDYSLSNITSPIQGAAVRYLTEKKNGPLPPFLFIVGDMTVYPLLEQEDKYMPILTGTEKATTPYLEQFENLNLFDVVSCQFALHYACQSEQIFRNFAKNIEKYCGDRFFGTCSDGKSIYSLLLGKQTVYFGTKKQIAGQYTKEYSDKESWVEEFGMPIKVSLESFDKPAIEYLVPFDKVVEIMKEVGFELYETKLFSEHYTGQTKIILTKEEQTFSFLNRSFVFKRASKTKQPAEPEKEEAVEEKKEEVVKKTRKLKKGGSEVPEPEPVLFYGADESKGPHRNLSNMSQHPIEIDGETYPTVEHYFQAMKAKAFQDEEMYGKIMKSKTPKAAKAAGKLVKNFVTETWEGIRDSIMQKALRAKFVQHPELRKQLLETGDNMIGEANARDMYWGIGTGIESDKSKTPSKWRGLNKLGKALMNLRTDFKNESD